MGSVMLQQDHMWLAGAVPKPNLCQHAAVNATVAALRLERLASLVPLMPKAQAEASLTVAALLLQPCC